MNANSCSTACSLVIDKLDANESVEQVLTYDLQGEDGQVRVPMETDNYEVNIVVTARDGFTQSEYVVDFATTSDVVVINVAVNRWQLVIYLFAACFGASTCNFSML